ncbi:MAG TPA: M20 family metallopeptidase [Pyrinomonadaceae bacterium]|jgi:acetylornithine deacetylase
MSADAIKFLRELIAIPSVNPMRAGAGERVERAAADYIESALRRAGVDCERQEVAEGRENLVVVVAPSGRGSQSGDGGLMLNSHMDTVPVANMAIDPFDPVVRDGCVYGRGSCDAKASIAAMMAAVISHAGRRERPRPLVFAATADEEFTFQGAWKLIERDWPVKACVVGEPTQLASIVAHKGVARWRARVAGVSAHGAMPHLGRSAIYDGARVALALEAYGAELSVRAPHRLLGWPTINVGRVQGGQAVNVVPDSCEFEIERRLLPGEDGRAAVRECEVWVRRRAGEDVELIFEEPFLLDPALDTSPEAALVRALDEARVSVTGRSLPVEGAHYGTDGSKLALTGAEVVVCGPGDIAQAHTKAEFVRVEQVETAVRLYDHLIANWPTRAES